MRSIKEDTYLYDPTGQIRPKPNKSKSVDIKGSMSNNVGDNLNQQNLLNYAAASIAN